MHDLYYKGRIYTRENHIRTGSDSTPIAKLGTVKNPLTLLVNNNDRKSEIEKLVAYNGLHATISVDGEMEENIIELNGVLNKVTTTRFEKTPNRNEPCSCGSGKKYKKCCG